LQGFKVSYYNYSLAYSLACSLVVVVVVTHLLLIRDYVDVEFTVIIMAVRRTQPNSFLIISNNIGAYFKSSTAWDMFAESVNMFN